MRILENMKTARAFSKHHFNITLIVRIEFQVYLAKVLDVIIFFF